MLIEIRGSGNYSPTAGREAEVIIACPACHTRFRVEETALAGAAGRLVGCAKCGHRWDGTAGRSAAADAETPAPPAGPGPDPVDDPPAAVTPAASGAPIAPRTVPDDAAGKLPAAVATVRAAERPSRSW